VDRLIAVARLGKRDQRRGDAHEARRSAGAAAGAGAQPVRTARSRARRLTPAGAYAE
jgi:hypothetical protein